MPTYDYECSKCGHGWELFQSIKAPHETHCPKCKRATAVRKIGMGAAILTGGRAAEPAEAPAATSAVKEAAKPAAEAKPAGDAKPAADAKPGAAKDASTAPAAATPAAPPSTPAPADTGKVNSTHPARDGRGAGNLRDAIARQRAASERGRKNPAKSPAKSMRSSSKRGRR
jgi:putative FmdB family regulatory protein